MSTHAIHQCLKIGGKRFAVYDNGHVFVDLSPRKRHMVPVKADAAPFLREAGKARLGQHRLVNHLVPDNLEQHCLLGLYREADRTVFTIYARSTTQKPVCTGKQKTKLTGEPPFSTKNAR